jgi:enamine deaminase RidA (YjgF/YER057c/UK114 family)
MNPIESYRARHRAIAAGVCGALILTAGAAAFGQKKRWNPDTLFTPEEFSHLTTSANVVKTVYVSAQSAARAGAPLAAGLSLREQTSRALENVGVALRAAGATPEDIVELHIYVADYQSMQGTIISRQLRRFFNNNMPVTSFVPVGSLVTEHASIEIDAVAEVNRRESPQSPPASAK